MKSKILNRKHILTTTVVCALGLAVFVNWYYTKQSNMEFQGPEVTKEYSLGEAQYVNSSSVQNADNYFSDAKLKRKKSHDEGIQMLENIINDSNEDENSKMEAKNKLLEYSNILKNETDIENLIKAQTNSECVVTISNQNVEVVLPNGVVNENNVVKIKEIILSKTNVKSDDITVAELNISK